MLSFPYKGRCLKLYVLLDLQIYNLMNKLNMWKTKLIYWNSIITKVGSFQDNHPLSKLTRAAAALKETRSLDGAGDPFHSRPCALHPFMLIRSLRGPLNKQKCRTRMYLASSPGNLHPSTYLDLSLRNNKEMAWKGRKTPGLVMWLLLPWSVKSRTCNNSTAFKNTDKVEEGFKKNDPAESGGGLRVALG